MAFNLVEYAEEMTLLTPWEDGFFPAVLLLGCRSDIDQKYKDLVIGSLEVKQRLHHL
jgi:hypothetical protein